MIAEHKKFENILVIRSGGMGDMLFVTPALRTIRANFPAAKISILTLPGIAGVLKNNNDIDQIIENRNKHFYEPGGLIDILKAYNFELVINFDPVKAYNYKIWPTVLKIKSIWSLVNHNSSPADFYNNDFKDFILTISEPKKHNVENCLFLLTKAGLEVGPSGLEVGVCKDDEIFIDDLLCRNNVKKGVALIAIHPGTSSSDSTIFRNLFARIILLLNGRLPVDRKGWPAGYYAELCNLLHKDAQMQIIITGSKHESRLAKQILRYMNFTPINLCGKTTASQLAALYRRCSVVVGSDTGPIHLAAAAGAPVVGLYGGYTDPVHTRPWTEESKVKIICSNLICAPCKNIKRKKICWRANCIRQIKPQEVFSAIKELLSSCAKRGK